MVAPPPDQNRQCRACNAKMYPIVREDEDWNGPSAQNGIRYACSECDKTIWIEDQISIAVSLFSGLGVLGSLIYAFINNLTDFIYYALFKDPTLESISIGVGLSFFLLVFTFGGVKLLRSGSRMLINRLTYPSHGYNPSPQRLALMFILGLFPLVFSIGFGMINHAFFEFGEEILLVLLPLLLAPFYFSPKLSIQRMSVFMATVFWFGLGGIVVWVFA